MNNNKIELLKAMVNKPIKVEIKTGIKDNPTLLRKRYVYSADTDSCVVTRTYVSEYIEPADRDDNFKTINYADINRIRITA